MKTDALTLARRQVSWPARCLNCAARFSLVPGVTAAIGCPFCGSEHFTPIEGRA